MPSVEGTVLGGRYRVGRRLGAGGMGEVFEATDEQTDTKVALKRIFPHFAGEPDLVERFEREARAVSKLSHPHIVSLADFLRPVGEPAFLVMELLRGATLRTIVQDGGPVAIGRAVKLALQILDALDATHDAGIVHRDIKPDNVFVEETTQGGERVKLLDFGVAKAVEDRHEVSLTETGALIGTLAFMAPEQARGEDVDARADLYGVGAVLYYAIAGRKPHEAKSTSALLAAVLDDPIVPLATRDENIPIALSRVVDRALAPEPDDRYASAEAMITALEPFVSVAYTATAPTAGTPARTPDRPDSTAPAARASARRKKRSRSAADADAATIEAARAMLALETAASPRASTVISHRRSLLLGLAGVAACALVYVFAIRDRPTRAVDPPATSNPTGPTSAPPPTTTESVELKRRLAAALKSRDAGACVAAFEELEATNSAEADSVRQLGAACAMLAGDCERGRAEFVAAARAKSQARAATTIELQGKRMAAANCPRDQLTADERALALKQDLANATAPDGKLDGALALARAVTPLAPDAPFRAECLDMLRETLVDLVRAPRCDDARALAKEVIDLDTPRMKPAADALALCTVAQPSSIKPRTTN